MLMPSKSQIWKHSAILLLLVSVTACSSDSAAPARQDPAPAPAPILTENAPLNGATNVAINDSLSATFSQPMDSASLNGNTFLVTAGSGPGSAASAVLVPGTVITSGATAVFWPSAYLAEDSTYTVTLTTGVRSAAGAPLAATQAWTISVGRIRKPGQTVNLGTAGAFAILAKSGISTVPASSITGDIGVSPIAATAITGFALTADASNVFSTSTQVIGKVFAADYAPPSPTTMTTAVSDMELAFTDAAGRAPGVTELGAGDIGGLTLAPGVYKWSSGLVIPANVTLTGNGRDVWIFQVAQNLSMASGTKVLLTGGARPKNIFWQVSGAVDVGTTAHLEGVVLSRTAVRMLTGSSVNGRLLAQTAVTLDTAKVVQPTW